MSTTTSTDIRETPDLISFKQGIQQERNHYLADINELLKVVEDNLEHGPLTESEQGWKNALLSLKARRQAA